MRPAGLCRPAPQGTAGNNRRPWVRASFPTASIKTKSCNSSNAPKPRSPCGWREPRGMPRAHFCRQIEYSFTGFVDGNDEVGMMRRLKRGAVLIGLTAMLGAGSAFAQDNLDRGKTMPQVYATDCGICHGDARTIAGSLQQRRLAPFLEQHYATSKPAAAAIAGYLAAVAQGKRQPPPQRTRGRKSSAKKSN